jgi:hypothetical protein
MAGKAPEDLTRTTLAVLFIVGLIAASFFVLRPFLAPTVRAATLVIATWPLMQSVEAKLGGRRGAAVVLMTLALLVVVLLPLWAAIERLATLAASSSICSSRLAFAPSSTPRAKEPPAGAGALAAGWPTSAARTSRSWPALSRHLPRRNFTGLGLALAGVPRAGLLAVVTLLLCIAQLGPVLVVVPVTRRGPASSCWSSASRPC